MNGQLPMALRHGKAGHPAAPWRRAAQGESRWPAAAAVVAASSDITPLSRWAKTMMMFQSAVSVAAVALVVARAVNIIG